MIVGFCIYFGRYYIASFYTSIDEIIAESDPLLRFFLIFYQFDSLMCI